MKYKTDLNSLEKETKVFRVAASTQGGQRANRKETGIRLHHIPSGIRVAVKGRFQGQNLETAFQRLKERLEKLNRPRKPRIPTRVPRFASEGRLKEKKEHSAAKHLRKKILE